MRLSPARAGAVLAVVTLGVAGLVARTHTASAYPVSVPLFAAPGVAGTGSVAFDTFNGSFAQVSLAGAKANTLFVAASCAAPGACTYAGQFMTDAAGNASGPIGLVSGFPYVTVTENGNPADNFQATINTFFGFGGGGVVGGGAVVAPVALPANCSFGQGGVVLCVPQFQGFPVGFVGYGYPTYGYPGFGYQGAFAGCTGFGGYRQIATGTGYVLVRC